MTTSPESSDDGPFLPGQPMRPPTTSTAVAEGTSHTQVPPGSGPPTGALAPELDAPFLPKGRTTTEPEPEPKPEKFDAKALLAGQRKRGIDNPRYGQMPSGTTEGRAAAEAARTGMRRKRRRNRVIAWFVGLFLIGGVVGAGYFAYQAYRDDQENDVVDPDVTVPRLYDDFDLEG